MGIKGTMIEAHYGNTPSFWTSQDSENLEFIRQFIEFDRFPNKPSDALKLFITQCTHWPFSYCRVEYPLPLLENGIIIYETPSLNVNNELTEAFEQKLNIYPAFICVLAQGLTTSSCQTLQQLVLLGHDPHRIFFVITHMEQHSIDEKKTTINTVRNELKEIDVRFHHSEIVILDPRTALDVLIGHKVYTKDYAEFLNRASSFLGRIFSFQQDLIIKQLGKNTAV